MSDEPKPLSELSLPARVESALEGLLAALKDHAKEDLVAVLVHGSAARGEYREGKSDVDLVVVLERDGLELLGAIGPPLLAARNAARIEAMILKKEEIGRAADVFPLLYDDIAHEGVLLIGESPFVGLSIHDDHRRLRIEQELREARIRLRLAIADAAAGLLRMEGVVERKLRQLRSPLLALLTRAGEAPSEKSIAAVVRAAGRHLEVDTDAILRVREAPAEAVPALITFLDAAIAHADRTGDAT